ncbi:caspase family protein [Amphritea sp.]|uniref:caspase family protein n=1 Tax=Amphritea sp. TaxID=1872502 RepID=UPI0025C520DF|nr:caspase family protein [Amphritea sp.]
MKKNHKNLIVPLFFLALLWASAALATNKALLVGVTKYPFLKGADLDGPMHDAELVRQVLGTRGFSAKNITMLSESDIADGKPTRQAIIDALERLASDVEKDDFIYLHFAGHGSRQPAESVSNTETDGLDEIFLPSDAAGWDEYIGSVKNALSDNVMAVYLDRIRDKGADVWVVFDSCHSGTMTRGGGFGEIRFRQVDAAVLGIPMGDSISSRGWRDETIGEQATFSIVDESGAGDADRGSLIAFSAAQATQTAPEMKLPRGAKDRKFHGLLTYTMMDALSKHRGISYSQLGQYILNQYRLMPFRNTQPLISGTNLNDSVFGEEAASSNVMTADVSKDKKTITISAGQLHNYNEGSLINLYSSALIDEDDFLGHAEIVEAHSLYSLASIVGVTEKTLPRKVFTVMKEPVLGFSMTVKAVASADMTESQILNLDKAVKATTAVTPMLRDWQEGEITDLRVSVFENKLWFLTADQSLPCEQQGLVDKELSRCLDLRSPQQLLNFDFTRRKITYEAILMPLESGLTRIAKGENLIRLQHIVSEGGGQQSPLDVEVTINISGKKSQYPMTRVPVFHEGDGVHIVIKNSSQMSQDVSVLYKDSMYGITQLFPQHSGEANRLEAGKEFVLDLELIPEPEGLEDLIILSQPASDVLRDFEFLEQPPLGVTTRGPVSAGVRDLANQSLMQVLFEAATTANNDVMNQYSATVRGARRSTPPELGSMEIYRWEVSQ